MIRKIISGGQTGADRAGLDFAIETGLEHGGYVPSGRKAEDGRIDELYNLVELSTSSYPARTRRNIEESDGTVIFSLERLLSGGNKKVSGLQPAAHGRLILQVLRTEFPFKVLLFSPYDDVVDQRHRPDECSQQPHAVDPDRDTELETRRTPDRSGSG